MAESARLLNGYTPKGYRGFESHPLRHFKRETPVKWGFVVCRIRQFLPKKPYLVQYLSNGLAPVGNGKILRMKL